jgi:hypothetical protein
MNSVGIDLHRKRSHVAVLDEAGNQVLSRRIVNDPGTFLSLLAEIGGESNIARTAASAGRPARAPSNSEGPNVEVAGGRVPGHHPRDLRPLSERLCARTSVRLPSLWKVADLPPTGNRASRRGGHRTSTGSKPIVHYGLPNHVLPEGPYPGRATVRPAPDRPPRTSFMPRPPSATIDHVQTSASPWRSSRQSSRLRCSWCSSGATLCGARNETPVTGRVIGRLGGDVRPVRLVPGLATGWL